MPWYIPEEVDHFKKLTVGNTVIMGRNTFNSIGHPLPDRHNIVVTTKKDEINGVHTASNIEQALSIAHTFRKPVFVIGGLQIYTAALPYVETLHVSTLSREYEGDTYMFDIDQADWQKVKQVEFDQFTYTEYKKKR